MSKKNTLILSALVCFTFTLFANTPDSANTEKKANPWAFSITTDFAYYPESDAVVDSETHFAPLTGAYSGLEARTTAKAIYTIPCPFSASPLFSANTLKFEGDLELTPVSVAPGVKITFTPIAFLQFSVGSTIGSAWDFIGIQGLAVYNETADEYESVDSFSEFYYNNWIQGMFQFDLAAILPGDWNHFVTMDTYKINFEGTTANCNGAWKYQGTGEYFTLPNWYTSLVLGYQTPAIPILNTIAINTEFSGYFNTDSIDDYYDDWDPSFVKISISPLTVFNLSKNDTLLVLVDFSSRRCFTSTASDDDTDFTLTSISSAREWYFKRVAVSWTHQF
jgi:hypothetical protein